MNEIAVDKLENPITHEVVENQSFSPIYMMCPIRAPEEMPDQMRQLAGMRGLMAKPSGEIIENAQITSTHSAKAFFGFAVLHLNPTARAKGQRILRPLKTANSGYLTRRLVDVVQDVIVSRA